MSEQTAYFNLVTRLTAVSDATTTTKMSSFRSELGKVTDASTMMGKAVATAAGFITYQLISTALMGVVNFVQGSIDEFVKFEYAMAGVARTVQDFAENEVVLTKFADTMSRKLGISAVDVAEAMQFMGSVGKDTGQIMGEFNDIAQMAVALQIDLEAAVSNVVKAQQIWNREGYSALQISDTLNEYTNRTALSMEWLAGALRMGGPAAAATNTSMEEMLAILVELAEAGSTGTTAGRGLNTILVQMGLKSEALLTHLRDLKEKGFDVNIEAMKGFADASSIQRIQMLAEATENLGDKERTQVAQMVAGTNFLKLMLPLLNSAADLTDNLAIANDAAGSSLEEYNTVMATSQMQLAQQQTKLESLQRVVGEKLTPAWIDFKVAIYEGIEALVVGTTEAEMAAIALRETAEATTGLEEAQRVLDEQVQDSLISQREADVTIALLRDEVNRLTASYEEEYGQLQKVQDGLGDYVDEQERASRSIEEAKSVLDSLNQTIETYADELRVAESAADRLNEVLSYLSGEITEAEMRTEELEWATESSRKAYEFYDMVLQQVNAEMGRTVAQLEEVNDAMYDNNLATSELRLSQMLLDRAYEEGEISQKEYEAETERLRVAMRDLRITGQELSIQNMKLSDTYEDQQEEAGGLEDKITMLKDADLALKTALEKLGDAGGDIVAVLKQIRDFMYQAGTATTELQSKISGLEAESGISIEAMMEDWEKYRDLILATFDAEDWAAYAALIGGLPSVGVDTGGGSDPDPTHKEYQYSQSAGVYRTGWYRDQADAKEKRGELAEDYPNAARSWTFDTKTVQGAAKGFQGWVNQPTMFMTGETGPEYVKVTPQGGDIGGGGGGMGNVTINLPNVTSVEDPEQVRRIFRRIMQELSGER